MSYDIKIVDKNTRETIQGDDKHNIAGGTYAVGGTNDAWINVTYNYSPIFCHFLGKNGIHFIEGCSPTETDERLCEAIKAVAKVVEWMYDMPGNNIACSQAVLIADKVMDKTGSSEHDAQAMVDMADTMVKQIAKVMDSPAYEKMIRTFSRALGAHGASCTHETIYNDCRAMAKIMENYATKVTNAEDFGMVKNEWRGHPKYDCLNSYWAPTPINVLKALCGIRAIGFIKEAPDKADAEPAETEWEIC